MKIAQVIAGLQNPAAGTSHTVLRLAAALDSDGAASEVHTLQPVPLDLSARHRIADYPLAPFMRRLAMSPVMRRGLGSADADVLHNHGVWLMPNVYAGTIARKRGIPLVFSPRGMFSAWAMARSRARKRFVWWCLGQRRAVAATTCFHATAEAEAQEIRGLGFRQPIAVIPNGIDLPEPTANPSGNGDGRRTVLFLSRIHPKKGIPVLLRAWRTVEVQHPDWDLVVAGPDEAGHLAEVEGLAREFGLERVSFPGPAYGPAKDALYRSADLFVLPTHSENFGMAVAEALAHGVPVITTTGAPWQELEGHGCGWWIELSVANLADALRTAMDLPEEERRRMGARGRAWMEASFAWPRIAAEMKGVYEWVLGGGPPPSCVVTD